MARISKEERARVRVKLLESAAEHFARDGLGGANINRISVDAGYAKGTVYNYFASKEELFTAVLSVGTERTIELYRQQAVEGDTAAHLTALVAADVALVRDHEAVMKTFVRELVAPQDAARERVQAGVAPLVFEAAAILERGQQAGEVRTDLSAMQLSTAFWGLVTMAYVQHWSSDGLWPTWEALPGLAVTLFVDGAGPNRKSS